MIIGVGVDAVAIERFAAFHRKSAAQLQRVYSLSEIEYCLASPVFSPQRFAARFAAREAAYKALASIWLIRPPLMVFFKACIVDRTPAGAPTVCIEWSLLHDYCAPQDRSLALLVSITHTVDTATAVVLAQQI